VTNGLRKMPAPKVLALYGERWGPHRSAAAWYFWRAVELKRAGKLPQPLEQIKLPRLLKLRRRARVAQGKGGPAKRIQRAVKKAAKKAGRRKLKAAKTSRARALR
jgi:hypothetical protein